MGVADVVVGSSHSGETCELFFVSVAGVKEDPIVIGQSEKA